MATKVLGVIDAVDKTGAFKRPDSQFRSWIARDSEFPPATGRYHLYVSLACPWACRTLAVRHLKGLEDCISVTVVHWLMLERGWEFSATTPKCGPDPLNAMASIPEIYRMVQPDYAGRFTVPILFDKETNTIVNNESAEIIRMLNAEFNEFATHPEVDLYPEPLREKIDELNSWIYSSVNNGVYRAGFATTQEAYEIAFKDVFEGLDKLEDILSKTRYLTGDTLTEADVRLFTTLIRFDPVYHGHFKCNLRRILDYPNLRGYLCELYQMPAFGETVDFEHIKKHYMQSHRTINPYGIVTVGPDLSWLEEKPVRTF